MQFEEQNTKYCSAILKIVKVIKNKENLRNCHINKSLRISATKLMCLGLDKEHNRKIEEI